MGHYFLQRLDHNRVIICSNDERPMMLVLNDVNLILTIHILVTLQNLCSQFVSCVISENESYGTCSYHEWVYHQNIGQLWSHLEYARCKACGLRVEMSSAKHSRCRFCWRRYMIRDRRSKDTSRSRSLLSWGWSAWSWYFWAFTKMNESQSSYCDLEERQCPAKYIVCHLFIYRSDNVQQSILCVTHSYKSYKNWYWIRNEWRYHLTS